MVFNRDGHTYVIPTLYARQGDNIVLYGSSANRMLRHASEIGPICVTVTIVDGLVLARSAFHHSMNYRSVVVFGRGEPVTDRQQKLAALRSTPERICPGRWADVRQASDQEVKATLVVSIPLSDASAKVRTGPPGDEDADYALQVWAGVVPIHQIYGPPEQDPQLSAKIRVPAYLATFVQQNSR